MTVLWVIVAIVVVAMGYVRLAPSDPTRWHTADRATKNADFNRGLTRVLEGQAEALGHLDAIIRATPRTQVLAGSVDEGMITYVTRTPIMGYPDVTTIEVVETGDGPLLVLAG